MLFLMDILRQLLLQLYGFVLFRYHRHIDPDAAAAHLFHHLLQLSALGRLAAVFHPRQRFLGADIFTQFFLRHTYGSPRFPDHLRIDIETADHMIEKAVFFKGNPILLLGFQKALAHTIQKLGLKFLFRNTVFSQKLSAKFQQFRHVEKLSLVPQEFQCLLGEASHSGDFFLRCMLSI